MSISALIFLLVYLTGLVLAFWMPMAGLCAYLWAFYNHPGTRWWGADLPDWRWSLIAAAVTLVAYVMHSLNSRGTAPEAIGAGGRAGDFV